jgi:limonene 1,2-monooxygenase
VSNRLRFGTFMAPFHPPAQNPTLALERDLELICHMDRLGYDEAWIGEHHSAGTELIASPEIFIATAAERTRHIKLGTGVVSLPYHNPLWAVERIVLLDHLTRGRIMFGAGPGALPTDSIMIGLDPEQTRPALEDSFDIAMRLLTSDEPVTADGPNYTLREARLHLRPYSDPLFDIAVAAVASPSGPRLAGKYGVGLLSVGATLAAGFDALALHWDVMEERARTFGRTVDRDKWRLVGLVHVAETREQAYRDVEYGIEAWFRYFQQVAAFPQMVVLGGNVREMIEFVNSSGVGAIGTVDDCAAQIDRLLQQSKGFGAYLILAHEWANPAATHYSFELIARYVMPHFQGSVSNLLGAKQRAENARELLANKSLAAVDQMRARHQAEVASTAGSTRSG